MSLVILSRIFVISMQEGTFAQFHVIGPLRLINMNLLLDVCGFVESWESITDRLLYFDSPGGLPQRKCNS